jgi:hypothetical protein
MQQKEHGKPAERQAVADEVRDGSDARPDDTATATPRRSKVRVLQYSRSDLLI